MTFSNGELPGTYFVLRHKQNGKLLTEYNFELSGAPNSNDNMMLVVFDEGSNNWHDALISAARHFGEWRTDNWQKDWELVKVEMKQTGDTYEDYLKRLEKAEEEVNA